MAKIDYAHRAGYLQGTIGSIDKEIKYALEKWDDLDELRETTLSEEAYDIHVFYRDVLDTVASRTELAFKEIKKSENEKEA